MKLDIKINEESINRQISYRIKKFIEKTNFKRYNPKLLFIYQLSVEITIFNCFTKAVTKLKEEKIYNFETYRLIYLICERLLEKKFTDLYLNQSIYDAKAHLLLFAKKYYKKLERNNKDFSSLYS